MLSVLDGSLSERLSVRMPDVRRLAMRDWPAFVRVGEEIVSGERAMPDAPSGVHACALVLASLQPVCKRGGGQELDKSWLLLSWKIHVDIMRKAVIRMLDCGGDVEAAARDSDLRWCIQEYGGHLSRFESTMNANPINAHIRQWMSAEQGLLRRAVSKWMRNALDRCNKSPRFYTFPEGILICRTERELEDAWCLERFGACQ